jgi:hypothetical protein
MKEDLQKYRKDLEIIRDTAKQVIKDFNMSGLEITFSGNELTAYEELRSQLTPVLSMLFRNDQSGFQNLLYRIDINERDLNNLLIETGTDIFPDAVADLILQREFRKVLSRRFYS